MTFTALLVVALAQAKPAGETLTLEQALDRARAENQDIKAAQARLAQSEELSRKVWAGYLPQIAAGGNYTYNNVEAKVSLPTGYFIRDVGSAQGPAFDPSQPASTQNPPGNQTSLILFPSGFRTAPIQLHNQFGAQLSVSQQLIAPALWPAIRNAYLAEKVTELNVENARREILFGVTQLYYGAANLKELVAINEDLLEDQKAREKDAQVRYGAGASPKVLMLRAQIDRARAEQDLLRANNAYQGAKISLSTLLNRNPDFEVTRPKDVNGAVDQSVARDFSGMIDRRPDLRAARASVDLAHGTRSGVWFKYAPSVGIAGTYRYSNVTGFTGVKDSYAIVVGLNWTLFDGGLREAELREAGARVAEANANLRNAENKAKDELQRALLDYESAKANQVKAEEQLRLAKENNQIIDVNFKAGAVSYLELTDATTSLRNAEVAAITEKLNADLAAIRIAKAAGLFEGANE